MPPPTCHQGTSRPITSHLHPARTHKLSLRYNLGIPWVRRRKNYLVRQKRQRKRHTVSSTAGYTTTFCVSAFFRAEQWWIDIPSTALPMHCNRKGPSLSRSVLLGFSRFLITSTNFSWSFCMASKNGCATFCAFASTSLTTTACCVKDSWKLDWCKLAP